MRAHRVVRHARKHTSRAPSIDLAAQAAAATIARVLSTPCQNTTLTPEPANVGLVEEATLCLINQERARHGEQPLSTNPELQNAAQGHGEEMISEDYFAHTSPSGETLLQRVTSSKYLSSEGEYSIGENIAWGTLYLAQPQAIVNAWIASPDHLANILEAEYRDTGISVVPQVPSSLAEGQPGALYSQEFGVRSR